MNWEEGQRVQVKSWEEMEQEFGLDEWNDINCRFIFAQAMEEYCGQIWTIRAISANGIVYFQEHDGYGFRWSTDMLKCIDEDNAYNPDPAFEAGINALL